LRPCTGWKKYAGAPPMATLSALRRAPPLVSTALRAFSARPDGLRFQQGPMAMSARGLRCYNSWYVPASWLKARAEGPKRAESGGRRPERADKLAQPPACGVPPAAPRPGSSEVEQPPCKRPVGGSNPFPGSPWRSLQPFSSVEKSVAFATIFGRSAQSAAGAWPGVCPSGQREQTVNLPASPTEVRILPPPHRRNMPL
jgi:hypothetical protein